MEWRYLCWGRVAHLIMEDEPRQYDVAVCGAHPRFGDDWYGTGDQNEYEKVERLPRCRRCQRF